MNLSRKSLLACALCVLAGGVWLPQLAFPAASPEPLSVETPAESAPERGANPTQPGGAAEDPFEVPDGSLDGVEAPSAAAPSAADNELASLLALLGAEEGPAPDLDASGPDPRRARVALREYAERNPLTGILSGPGGALALLGHRIVRVGERLPGAPITVQDIGQGWVQLSSEGESLRVELPAFTARSAGSAATSVPAPAEPAAAPAPAAPAPVERGA